MTAGLKLKIPASITDTSLPVLRDDSLLVPGSLLLVDTAHSTKPAFGAASAGVPSSGAAVPNIAASLAAPVVGAAAGALAASFTYDTLLNDGTHGKIERGTAGTMHVMVTQAETLANGAASLNLPAPIIAHMIANPTHHYYWSLWLRVTRASTVAANTTPVPVFGSLISSSQGGLGYIPAAVNSSLSLGNSPDGQDKGAPQTLGATAMRFAAALVSYGTGPTLSGMQANQANALALWGRGNASSYNGNAGLAQKLPSWAFERTYLEDLTVSGRTYAQVAAADEALRVADHATGGRFNVDTLSNPATALP